VGKNRPPAAVGQKKPPVPFKTGPAVQIVKGSFIGFLGMYTLFLSIRQFINWGSNMIKIWGWEKKPRTMLRFLKIGDIFCFKYDDHTYRFGRIMAKVIFHIVEILDYVSDQPVIREEDILGADRLIVTPLDTYSLFDRRSEGEWRIIGHQEDYVPPEDAKDIWFAWGIASGCRKSNVFNQTVFISEEEWSALPSLSPGGDYDVKREVRDRLGLV